MKKKGKICEICGEKIVEIGGKLFGSIVKAVGLDHVNQMIFVCDSCQKDERWIEKAKVISA
jgi:hypothetical protein